VPRSALAIKFVILCFYFALGIVLCDCRPAVDKNQADTPDENETPSTGMEYPNPLPIENPGRGEKPAERKSTANLNVKVENDYTADLNCEDLCSCVGDYYNFLALTGKNVKPVSEEELAVQSLKIIANIKSNHRDRITLIDGAIPRWLLAEIIVKELNLGFLLKDFAARPLTVKIIREEPRPDFMMRELLFQDPYVGSFKGLLLLPNSPGPFPVVIALPGHSSNAEDFCDKYHGHEFPEHGFAILILDYRVMCGGNSENEVTRLLLHQGFSLMTMRIYEYLLAMKYLQFANLHDGYGIGLIGHSGGSVVGNLLYWINDDIDAYVSDCTGVYFGSTDAVTYNDETVPNLYRYFPLINDLTSGPTPVLMEPYGYEKKMNNVFTFFEKNLKKENLNRALQSMGSGPLILENGKK